mgnify:FL=1|jgi:hypothetical protein
MKNEYLEMNKMAAKIGTMTSFLRMAEEIIERASFADDDYGRIMKNVWLEQIKEKELING